MASIFSGILTFQKITAFLEIIFFPIHIYPIHRSGHNGWCSNSSYPTWSCWCQMHNFLAIYAFSTNYKPFSQTANVKPMDAWKAYNLFPRQSCSKQTVQPSRSDSTFSFPESLTLVDLGIKASLCKLQMAIFVSAGGSEPLRNEKSYSMNSSDALILEASKFLTSAGRLSASVK